MSVNREEKDETPLISQTNKGDDGVIVWSWIQEYTKFVYNYPFVLIIATLFITVFLTIILVFVFGVSPSASTNYYRWSGDDITSKWDAFVGASSATYGSILGMFGGSIPMPKQFQLTQMGCIIYERPGENMINVDVLREVWKMEDKMHDTPGWSDYCFKVPMEGKPEFIQSIIRKVLVSLKDRLSSLEEDTMCVAFKSIITEFKDKLKSKYNITKPQPNDLTDAIIREHIKSEEARIVATFFGNDYDNNTMYSSRMRSMFPFAFPLKGYRNKMDRQKEQIEKLGKWQLEFTKPLFEMLNEHPLDVHPYCGFPFALEFMITDLILKQVWWLVGSFAFLFFFAFILQKSLFTSLLGMIGVFFPIPCAVCTLNGVFGIRYLDVIDVIGLFLICGIGADCVFIVFEMFRQAKTIYGNNNKMRLAYATQRGLIALSTSISTSAASFLALLSSGVRIMNFFGIFCFLLLVFTFLFTFTWYLSILAIWSKKWEKIEPCEVASYNSGLSQIVSSGENELDDYPHKGLFDFVIHLPTLNINAGRIPISKYNRYEKFIYNKLSPVVYFYRLPICLLFGILSLYLGIYSVKCPQKANSSFYLIITCFKGHIHWHIMVLVQEFRIFRLYMSGVSKISPKSLLVIGLQ